MKPFTKAKIDMWLGGFFTLSAIIPPYDWSTAVLACVAILWTLSANIDLNKLSK